MRTIIAGSRSVTDARHLDAALAACGWMPTVVVCGCAVGVDRLGFEWAHAHRLPVAFHPAWQRQADWAFRSVRGGETIYWPNSSLPAGNGAGYARNSQMADHAEALIALWDGQSRGTSNMIETARKRGLKVYVHILE